MTTNLHESFLQLVRLGIGTSKRVSISKEIDWVKLKSLSDEQGLSAVILDALNTEGMNLAETMPFQMKLEWIGEVLQSYEQRYNAYEKAINSLAGLYNQHGFKMMVLKGYTCSLDWPKPEHRPCGDIDIWQFGKQKEADNTLRQVLGPDFKIDNSHHHHTVFEWGGFSVENHYDFVNVHARRSSKELEKIFKELGVDDSHWVEVNGEKVYLPPPNLHALFLIRHMVSHFAAAEISLRQVLDWAFFVEKHAKVVDWKWLLSVLEEYHMRNFFDSINGICVDDLGFSPDMFCSVQFLPTLKERVLDDILEPEYGAAEPSKLFSRLIYKYRRWQGNAWKQEMCYGESRGSAFWTGIWTKILRPASI